jgi:hypothetical protein
MEGTTVEMVVEALKNVKAPFRAGPSGSSDAAGAALREAIARQRARRKMDRKAGAYCKILLDGLIIKAAHPKRTRLLFYVVSWISRTEQ